MSHPIIRFDHATFGFPGTVALEDISLSIPESEFVGVIGPSTPSARSEAKSSRSAVCAAQSNRHQDQPPE